MCLGSSLTTKYFAAVEFGHNRTGQKPMYGFIMVCTDLPATGENCNTLKSKDLAILASKK